MKHVWMGISLTVILAAVTSAAAYGEAGSHTVDSLDAPSTAIDVRAKYEESTSTQVVYSVDVEWGIMEFTYHESAENRWNPQTHEYELSVTGAWRQSGNEVTVKNHSNAEVNAALSFQAADGQNITGAFYQGEKKLDGTLALKSAVGTSAAAPPSETVYLMLNGSLDSAMTDFHKIGTILVTVN